MARYLATTIQQGLSHPSQRRQDLEVLTTILKMYVL